MTDITESEIDDIMVDIPIKIIFPKETSKEEIAKILKELESLDGLPEEFKDLIKIKVKNVE